MHSCCWAVCGTADTSLRLGLIWLKKGISCFSSAGAEYPPKWLSILQEKSNRSVSQSQNRFPDSPFLFWIQVVFLSLLDIWNYFVYLLFSFIINLSLTSLSTSVFQSSFLQLFDFGLNLDQRKLRPQDSHVRCTDQGRFLDMDSFASSETEGAPQSSWMCFRDHQSGKEFRCTFPDGFAGIGLMPG